MKKLMGAMPALLGIACLLNSCVTGKNAVTVSKPSTENSGTENTSGAYVELKDGTIRKFSKLQLVTGMFTAPHLLADGKEKFFASQVRSYLDGNSYAVSQEQIAAARKTYVAVEALPGFAVRVVKGKINVYRKKFYNGQYTVDEFYLQQGDDAAIVAYTPELFNELIRDNPEAAKYFNTRKKKEPVQKRLIAAASLYNGNQTVSLK